MTLRDDFDHLCFYLANIQRMEEDAIEKVLQTQKHYLDRKETLKLCFQ